MSRNTRTTTTSHPTLEPMPYVAPATREYGIHGTPLGRRVLRSLLLVLTDLGILVTVGLLAHVMWTGTLALERQFLGLTPFLALFVAAFASQDLYPGFGLGAVETLRRVTISTSAVFTIIAAAAYTLQLPAFAPATYALAWALALLALPLTRYLVLSWFRRVEWWGEPAVLIGVGALARQTIRALKGSASLGFSPRWVLDCQQPRTAEVEGRAIVGNLNLAPRFAQRGVRVAIIALDDRDRAQEIALRLQSVFPRVIVAEQNSQLPLEGVRISNLGGVLGVEFVNRLLLRRNAILKRFIDVIGASLALCVALPIWGIAALSVRIVSPGKTLFVQRRQGLGGRSIPVLKLRTMFEDAQERLKNHLEENQVARQEWQTRFKLHDDPRIVPRVGKLLRRFSIDELPQLVNVLRGDMSLVGPRPFPAYHLKKFPEDFLDLRHRVRPGMTGLWQVVARDRGGLPEQQALDAFYIRNWSLWLDIYVLARSILTVLAGRGS